MELEDCLTDPKQVWSNEWFYAADVSVSMSSRCQHLVSLLIESWSEEER